MSQGKTSKRRPENQKAYQDGHERTFGGLREGEVGKPYGITEDAPIALTGWLYPYVDINDLPPDDSPIVIHSPRYRPS